MVGYPFLKRVREVVFQGLVCVKSNLRQSEVFNSQYARAFGRIVLVIRVRFL